MNIYAYCIVVKYWIHIPPHKCIYIHTLFHCIDKADHLSLCVKQPVHRKYTNSLLISLLLLLLLLMIFYVPRPVTNVLHTLSSLTTFGLALLYSWLWAGRGFNNLLDVTQLLSGRTGPKCKLFNWRATSHTTKLLLLEGLQLAQQQQQQPRVC